MNPQIAQLNDYFTGLTTPQKKEFIVNLQNKMKTQNLSSDYKVFLSKCVNTYNAEARGEAQRPKITPQNGFPIPSSNAIDSSTRNGIATSKTTENVKVSLQQNKKKYIKIGVASIALILVTVFVVNLVSGFGNSDRILGTWRIDNHTTYRFHADGRFTFSWSSNDAFIGGFLEYSGTFRISGNTLIYDINPATIRGSGLTGNSFVNEFEAGTRPLTRRQRISFRDEVMLLTDDGNTRQLSRR